MHKTVSFGTAAVIGFALAACGSADRSESSESDANAVTVNEVGTVDNSMTAATNDMGSMAPTGATEFAAAAAASDLFEITSSKMAETQAQSANVKMFASMLVKDHTNSTAELKQIASKESIALSPPTLAPDMQSKIDALKNAKGAQFDTLYMSQQVPAHEDALKLHQGYAQNGENVSLKAFASKTAPVVSKHLDEARAMSEQ